MKTDLTLWENILWYTDKTKNTYYTCSVFLNKKREKIDWSRSKKYLNKDTYNNIDLIKNAIKNNLCFIVSHMSDSENFKNQYPNGKKIKEI